MWTLYQVEKYGIVRPTSQRILLVLQWFDHIGVPLEIVQGYRSCEEQDYDYSVGASDARCGESYHNFGRAVDVIFKSYGYDVPNAWWSYVGKVAQFYGLRSGCGFRTRDCTHIEG